MQKSDVAYIRGMPAAGNANNSMEVLRGGMTKNDQLECHN